MADKKKSAEKKEKPEVKKAKSGSAAKTDKKPSQKPSEKKPSIFSKIGKYFRECKSEIKKIVWPTPKATFKNMGVVLVVLIVVGLFIFGLDTGFGALLKLIMDI
ncbi:MAG: preprotein translocase subunit SecE [Lachnospiraceae bacterium]|nr:preprotein translocase subunit SecE [Lachnospiraceae bacterium]